MAFTKFEGEYVMTAVLGTMKDGRTCELGHYKDGKTEYGEKVYIRSKYTTKKGEERESIAATKLTIADLIELQTLDLSEFTSENPNETLEDV